MRALWLGLLLLGAAGAQSDFSWPEGKRVAVSFSFDDARLSQLERGLPLFGKHQVKVTFYVNPGPVEKNVEGWKRALREGHEIGNHSTHHPCTGNFPWSRRKALEELTLAQLEEDFQAANRAISRMLGVTPATFAYPCGSKFVGRGTGTQSYVPLVARLFLAGRGFRDEAANDPTFADLAQLLGVDSDGLKFAQMRELVEKAEAQRGWIIFAGHDIGEPGRQTTEAGELERFFEWARDAEHGVWVDRVDTIARYVRSRRAQRAE